MSHIDANATQAIKECMQDIGFDAGILDGLFKHFDQSTTGLAVIVNKAVELQDTLEHTRQQADPNAIANVIRFKARMKMGWRAPEIIVTTLQTALGVSRKTIAQYRTDFMAQHRGQIGFWRERFFRYAVMRHAELTEPEPVTQTATPEPTTETPTETKQRTFTESELLANLARRDTLIKDVLAGKYLSHKFNLRNDWKPHRWVTDALSNIQIDGQYMATSFIYKPENLQAYISYRRSTLKDRTPIHQGFFQWTAERFFKTYALLKKELDRAEAMADAQYREQHEAYQRAPD